MTDATPGEGDPAGNEQSPESIAPPTDASPDAATPPASPPPPDAPTQRTGIISAAPVGWSAAAPPPGADPSGAPSDQPLVAWSPPAAQVARPAVGAGLVIAGFFSRLVAFVIDLLVLGCITIAIGLAVGAYRQGSTQAVTLGVGLVGVAIGGLYFVAFWTSGWRATLGMDLWRVAVQPGKPFAFGTAERPGGGRPVLLFGLPGNPVSSAVTFELFVRPAIRKLAGRRHLLRPIDRAILADAVTKSHGRRAFMRVEIERDENGMPVRDERGRIHARLAGGQGSHVISALAAADALAVVSETDDSLEAGSEVALWWLDRA